MSIVVVSKNVGGMWHARVHASPASIESTLNTHVAVVPTTTSTSIVVFPCRTARHAAA